MWPNSMLEFDAQNTCYASNCKLINKLIPVLLELF